MSIALPPQVTSRQVSLKGTFLHYLRAGSGEPVVFLHGNPTSSVLWREIVGPVADSGRQCVALDLIGMGRSGKPDLEYRLADHIGFVDAFLDALALTGVTFVGHDWGAVIALDYARRFPGRVRGVAFLEGHIHPIEHWSDLDDGGRDLFGRLRTPGVGEQLIFEENLFIEAVLPGGMLRTLTSEEWDAYREPYLDPADRAPMLRWTREIPIEAEPADVVELILANQAVIADPAIPTLLLHASPGAVIGPAEVAWCREHGAALTIADVGPGLHFLPEDCPKQIVANLCQWLDQIEAT